MTACAKHGRQRTLLKPALCIAIAAFVSCVSAPKYGVKYDASGVSKITPCVTTQAELLHSLGPPYRKGIVSSHEHWTWYYYPGYKGGMGAYEEAEKNRQNLIVAFNKEGLVVDFVYNPPMNIVWSSQDRCNTK